MTFMGPTKFVFMSFIIPSALIIRLSIFRDGGLTLKYTPELLAGAVRHSARVVDKDIDATPYGQSLIYALFYLSEW